MTLQEEFKEIINGNISSLNNDVIIPYVINCFKKLSSFISEKTNKSISFSFDNTDMIIQGFYTIGVENCKKEYENYNSILKFKAQYQLDYQIMKQTRQKWFNNEFVDYLSYKNDAVSLDTYKFIDRKSISEKDMKFYIDKYKFYNSFQINLS